MDTHHLIYWLFIGLVSGAVAGKVVRGRGFGLIANTIVGLAGAFLGGYLFRLINPQTIVIDGTLDELVVAFIGAVILLSVLRLINPRWLHH